MHLRTFLVLCVASIRLTQLATAQTVLAFDGSRCYAGANQYWLTGSGMTAPYGQLISHGYTVQTTSLITAAGLSGVKVFFTGTLNRGSTLSATEAADLQTWVAGGGSLLFMGENDLWATLDGQLMALFSAGSYGGQYNASGVTMTIAAPTHPMISGPFGTVTNLTGFNTPGRWVSMPSSVAVVATNPDGSGALLAFQYGAGRVVFANDTNYFEYPPAYGANEVILWDNTIDWLAHASCTGSIASYCTSSTTTHSCNPVMSATGMPSAAASSGFTLACSSVEGVKSGIIFYGVGGATAAPWASGSSSVLCVKAPTQRTTTQNSGGTINACDGSLSIDFLAFMAAHPAALGQPLAAGQQYNAQSWFRDPPAPKTTNLSNGIQFTLCP
jgi:hypothetical protein